jgi:prolyl oligopeptidase
MDSRPTLAAPDDDPHLWLEEITGEKAVAWADAQSAATRAAFDTAAFRADRDTLAALLDRPGKLMHIARRGHHVYNFWQDATTPRGLWRRTTLDSFRTEAPAWETMLDIDALAKAESEDWVYGGAGVLPGTHDRAMLRLSRGGSDAVVLREFDMVAKTFVGDGFHLPEAKGNVEWWDRDTLLLASAFGGDVTSSGYSRTVRVWRRGTDPAAAPVIFAVPKGSMRAFAFVDQTGGKPRAVFFELPSFFERVQTLGDLSGPTTRLELPPDAMAHLDGDHMVIGLRSAWTVGDTTHPADSLLATSLTRFCAGDRTFTPFYRPGERRSLIGLVLIKGRAVLSVLDEFQPRFDVWTATPSGWVRADMPGMPTHGVVNVSGLDVPWNEGDGALVMTSEDPLTPPTLSLIEPGKAPVIMKQASRGFDPTGLVVTQHNAVAPDGERIPYTQIGPAKPTGDAPVYMYGYGGFEVTERPNYSAGLGKLWLEKGGTVVRTNIRGGGEFGVRWHEAGRREKKITSHDDFATIASDLVQRGITTPKRIGADGGSNGGILISNMLTRYPERFGGLSCTIPLIDMRRYSKLLAGASWIAEYGDPDKPEDWAFLQRYSAYHNAVPGKDYPPILIATTRKDDRVHPGHARKFAAKLQAMGYTNARYFELEGGGHGSGRTNAERATFTTLGLTFLADAIGWRPGSA